MNLRAKAALDRLSYAMENTAPGCDGDDRFTDDTTPPADVASICAACPLQSLCEEFALAEKPKAGIWNGKRYRTNKTKGTSDDD